MSGRSEIKERGAGPTPSFRAALAEAADLIQEVLDTTESAAGRIVEEAEDRARRIRQEADAERGFRVQGSADSPGAEERALARRLGEALDLMMQVAEGAELTARDADALRSLASSLRTTLARPPVAGPEDSGSSTSTPQDAEHDEQPPDSSETIAYGKREAPASRERPAPAPSPPGDLADAQLLAVQMALAGRSDQEIERRLRQQFRDEEVDLALDVVGKLGADRR